MPVRWWLQARVAAAGFLAALFIAGTASAQDFYDVSPAELAGPPGSIIRYLGMQAPLSTAMAYRVMYRSVGLEGRPIAVSGIIVAPYRTPPAGGWPVVAWAHPTTGIARKCAPSIMWPNPVDVIPGIAEMVERDYVVAATDYPGLGGPGVHPYMVGISEGRAVLDIVRAARHFSLARASDRVVVWGHSQGGQAAYFAGQLAASYAPELKLLGVATAAPATKLGQLFEDDINTLAGRILSALLVESWSKVYGLPLTSVVSEAELPTLKRIGEDCIDLLNDELRDLLANRDLPKKFLTADPVTTAPWREHVIANVPSAARAARVPYFVAQGTADTTVDPPITVEWVRELCAERLAVEFVEMPGVDHAHAGTRAAGRAVAWMTDRFEGKPPPSTCR